MLGSFYIYRQNMNISNNIFCPISVDLLVVCPLFGYGRSGIPHCLFHVRHGVLRLHTIIVN
ncbi:MAG: hypothetical protein ACJA08_000783 [Cyclobacteriaceae bacterium]|jgi:hypothetical protein